MRSRQNSATRFGALVAGALILSPTAAIAQELTTTEHRITDSPAIDTTPTLGAHDHFSLVVYTSQEIGPAGILPGVIHVQFLNGDGAPVDPVRTISDGSTNDKLNDVHGSRVVYTAFESTTSQEGHIHLHDLSTGITTRLFEQATFVRQARIHDDVIVWVQGGSLNAEIYYYDLNWEGTGRGPQAIAGGSPAALNVEIGDNYIVCNTFSGATGTADVMAIDRSDPALDDPNGTPTQITIAARTDAHEQNPSTSGDWIVWETRPEGVVERTTHALNPGTGETRVIQNIATSRNPSIDGDLVAYESNAGESGAFDIYLYRLSDGATFQITNDSNDQLLNNIHGHHVAYVDNRSSFADVFVTNLEFADDPGGGELPEDLEELCGTDALPAGATVVYDGAWNSEGCPDDERGHGYGKPCAHFKERHTVLSSGGGAVLCLTVSGEGAPKGHVDWNGEEIFRNSDFANGTVSAAVSSFSTNALRVKVKLRGHDHDAEVSLRVIDVPSDAIAGCAASKGSPFGALFLGLLGLMIRRRKNVR